VYPLYGLTMYHIENPYHCIEMKKITRDDLYILVRHSNLGAEEVGHALKKNVYHDKDAWQKFVKQLLISLGLGFAVAGIVFFFAYNWANLHKFAKIGLAEGLLITAASCALFFKNRTVKNIILTVAAMLVGVLFAVFGQIYQTGANAYDFFLAWTIFITLWVVVANFAPLWLLYLILINTTFSLYAEQVASNWSSVLVMSILFAINALALFIFILISKFWQQLNVPKWFLQLLAVAVACCATIGISIGIFERYTPAFPILILTTLLTYGLGIKEGLASKKIFYLAVISLSTIVIGSSLLLKVSHGEGMFLLVSLFIVAAVTLVIKNLLHLQKKWINE
jgi:uncharacterized membrane protein